MNQKQMGVMRRRVLAFVEALPGSTATQISKSLHVPTASLSSLLVRMCATKELRRKVGVGPRGGYGYFVIKAGHRGLSAWARLRKNPFV